MQMALADLGRHIFCLQCGSGVGGKKMFLEGLSVLMTPDLEQDG